MYAVLPCNRVPNVTVVETRVNGTCIFDYTLTRVWTATDAAGNTATAVRWLGVCAGWRGVVRTGFKHMTVCMHTEHECVVRVQCVAAS